LTKAGESSKVLGFVIEDAYIGNAYKALKENLHTLQKGGDVTLDEYMGVVLTCLKDLKPMLDLSYYATADALKGHIIYYSLSTAVPQGTQGILDTLEIIQSSCEQLSLDADIMRELKGN